MQRTLEIVLVRAILLPALALLALEPGCQPSEKMSQMSPPETASESEPFKPEQAGDDETAPGLRDPAGPPSVDETETIVREFQRFMAEKQAGKGAATPAREASPLSSPGQQPPLGAERRGGSQSRTDRDPLRPAQVAKPPADSSAPSRAHWLSALPTRVVRIPDDLADLDAEQPIGQLTVTGEQFTNWSLRQLTGLRVLSLSVEAINIGNAGLVHVAKLAGLRELRLWTPGVTDEGLEPLAALVDLELLDLEGTSVRGTGLVHLSGLRGLKQLTLGAQAEDRDLRGLSSLPHLEELDLRSCRRLTEAAVDVIARQPHVRLVWLPPQVGRADRQAVRALLPRCQVRW